MAGFTTRMREEPQLDHRPLTPSDWYTLLKPSDAVQKTIYYFAGRPNWLIDGNDFAIKNELASKYKVSSSMTAGNRELYISHRIPRARVQQEEEEEESDTRILVK